MPRPNVIFILADDMGYGDFGRFNDSGLPITPVLDSLLDESVCLTQHYSGSAVCAPARAAFLTGRYPQRTGAVGLREVYGLCNIAPRETTVADLLQRAGYATGLVGKWHNGTIGKALHPTSRGFDEFIGFRSGAMPYWDWVLDWGGDFRKADGRYLTDVFTDAGIDFVTRHRASPFFLHLAYNAPHSPLEAPESDVRPFRESGLFNDKVSTLYGMIHNMDRNIGRLLETLDRLGLRENTIVCFTSDNGPDFHGTATERFNCGFRGAKYWVYEGGIRVPMLMRWPAGLTPGSSDSMIHFCDWLPTLLAATGIDERPPLPLDGVDVLPVLRGEHARTPEKRFWQFTRYGPMLTCNAAMRDGPWKLVRPGYAPNFMTTRPEDRAPDGAMRLEPWNQFPPRSGLTPLIQDIPLQPLQLFNLAEDASEETNLADAYPDRVARMARELEAWYCDVERDRSMIESIWE